ncbi:MAG: hypothetical protein JSV88_23400 [Candidatus Aminicenantes bacterium]|nr:MAG: hypothetical protein JSV88_23400 [Candidatus Aminicenantes bacterium]
MKKIFLRIIIFAVILVVVFCPYLLIIDFKKYSPVVLIVWIVSVAYYLWIKRRRGQLPGTNGEQISKENEETVPDNVSRETNETPGPS